MKSSKLKFLSYIDICKIHKISYEKDIDMKYSEKKKRVEDFMFQSGDESFYRIVRFLNSYHSGLRKGDKIPEIQHFLNISVDIIDMGKQVSLAGISLIEAVKIALLHDLYEDYSFSDAIWDKKIKRLKDKSPISIDTMSYIVESDDLLEKVMTLSKIEEKGKQKKS